MCSPGQDRLEFCPCQSLYFYVNIVARRLEQVPAGNLSEEHATRRVGMCLSSVGSCRLTTLHDFPLFPPQPLEYTFICILSTFDSSEYRKCSDVGEYMLGMFMVWPDGAYNKRSAGRRQMLRSLPV